MYAFKPAKPYLYITASVQTLERIQSFRDEFQAQTESADATFPFALVGNKTDLADDIDAAQGQAKSFFNQHFGATSNALFFTSAKVRLFVLSGRLF